MRKNTVVAIDGPVAAGKSTVGQRVAQALGCPFVDTGLMYRAVGWLALQQGIDLADTASLTGLTEQADLRVDGSRVWVGPREIGGLLRTPEVDAAASRVASVPGVRAALVAKQRAIAASGGVVMVGRDIGTVVLKDAPVKVYLSASAEERARRRYEEMAAKGVASDRDRILTDLRDRDKRDMERETSPLHPAEDARIINTDDLTLEQVVERILALVQAHA
jgi:cytidylate kinase